MAKPMSLKSFSARVRAATGNKQATTKAKPVGRNRDKQGTSWPLKFCRVLQDKIQRYCQPAIDNMEKDWRKEKMEQKGHMVK